MRVLAQMAKRAIRAVRDYFLMPWPAYASAEPEPEPEKICQEKIPDCRCTCGEKDPVEEETRDEDFMEMSEETRIREEINLIMTLAAEAFKSKSTIGIIECEGICKSCGEIRKETGIYKQKAQSRI